MSEMRFDGRVAVITGAGRGLGRAYALLLASRGAKVVVNDPGVSRTGDATEEGPAREVVKEIISLGGEAAVSTDSVATPAGGQAIIDTAVDHYGRVDVLIHNAGINRPAPFREMTWEQFSATLDVHLHGAFHVSRAAFPLMCDAGYGRIVLTGSIAGLYGDKNIAGYCVGKAGSMGLANALALEGNEYGVNCNLIVPAAVTRLSEGRDTSSFPTMTPDQVAPTVAWLCHESCKASGEMFVSLAGRIARAYVAETTGVFQPDWTVEQVAEQMEAIEDTSDPQIFSPFPNGFYDHLGFSFDMAKDG